MDNGAVAEGQSDSLTNKHCTDPFCDPHPIACAAREAAGRYGSIRNGRFYEVCLSPRRGGAPRNPGFIARSNFPESWPTSSNLVFRTTTRTPISHVVPCMSTCRGEADWRSLSAEVLTILGSCSRSNLARHWCLPHQPNVGACKAQPLEVFTAATSTTTRYDEFCLGRLLWVLWNGFLPCAPPRGLG
jgi:hypothetical protein